MSEIPARSYLKPAQLRLILEIADSGQLRQAAAKAPAGQLLVETDAPYMTPEPYRGQRNEPALIGHTYECIARVRHQTVQALAAEVNDTFDRVYGLR